jgi:hypothetical protein
MEIAPSKTPILKKWFCRVFAFCVLLAALALAAGVATSERSHRDVPAVAMSGIGNLVPVF